MIQLVVNTNLLREIDDRALINRYAKYCYEGEESVENDILIKQNLTKLLDWDTNGDNGVPVFCSKFESIKRKDWIILIQFIKDNKQEIKELSYAKLKKERLENIKLIRNRKDSEEFKKATRLTSEDYNVSGRGKPARTCTYEGRTYKSRLECAYKEGITQNQLYRYLEKTGQV